MLIAGLIFSVLDLVGGDWRQFAYLCPQVVPNITTYHIEWLIITNLFLIGCIKSM